MRAEAAGPACAVIGIGLNVALGAALIAQINATGVAATDLSTGDCSCNLPRGARARRTKALDL